MVGSIKYCGICRQTEKQMKYKIAQSNICDECYSNDYITVPEVAKMIGIDQSGITRLRTRKQFDKLPECDALRMNSSPLWKRETMERFVESQPKFDLKIMKAMIADNATMMQMSRDLGVERHHVHRFFILNGLKCLPYARPTIRLADELENEGYILAHRLLNKCIHNTLHI